jgi:nitrite reductase/ring-hydroxylating ferredoxin subunit
MTMKRRDVLKAGAVTGALAVVGVSVSSCAKETAVTMSADSIAVTDIPVGGGVIVSEPPVVLTQPTAGDVKAFTSICPHQGCKVSEVSNNEIYCPCHGSKFSALDGSVIQGPATEGLSAAAVAVDGTKVSFG